MKKKICIETICFLLTLLFVYAAISKLFDYSSFQLQFSHSLALYHIRSVAWALPLAELVTAVMLVIPQLRLPGLYASFILMIAFSLYIIGMLLFQKHLPCSCGGVLKQLTWKQHLLLNIFFIAISFAGIILTKNKNIADQQKRQRSLTVS